MIELHSEKSCEQIRDLLKEQVKQVKLYNFLFPIRTWGGFDSVPVGKIKRDRFWLIRSDWNISVIPYRFFYAKIVQTDCGTMIVGKFRHHFYIYVVYSVAYVLLTHAVILVSFQSFVATSIIFALFFASALLVGIFSGRKMELKTIEFIKSILF